MRDVAKSQCSVGKKAMANIKYFIMALKSDERVNEGCC